MSEEIVGNITFNNSLVGNMATFNDMMKAMGFKFVGVKKEDGDQEDYYPDCEKDVRRGM